MSFFFRVGGSEKITGDVTNTATEEHLGILAVRLLLQPRCPSGHLTKHQCITTEEQHKNETCKLNIYIKTCRFCLNSHLRMVITA